MNGEQKKPGINNLQVTTNTKRKSSWGFFFLPLSIFHLFFIVHGPLGGVLFLVGFFYNIWFGLL
jgi:hypothetical protein